MIIAGNDREKRARKANSKNRHYYRIERHYGTFQRVLSLPEDAVASDINASISKELLTIGIPRQEAEVTDRRKISIQQY